jgi:ribonuclease HI
MELMAVIQSLEAVKTTKYPIEVYSDSKYVIDSIEKGWVFNWVKKPNFAGKKNEDLWRRFLKSYDNFDITFHWVKGHNGHPENERCDVLATTEAIKFK